MSKKLQMTFTAQDGKTSSLSLDYPVEGLNLAAVQKAATDIVPIFVNANDSPLQSLKEAKYIETTETLIED